MMAEEPPDYTVYTYYPGQWLPNEEDASPDRLDPTSGSASEAQADRPAATTGALSIFWTGYSDGTFCAG